MELPSIGNCTANAVDGVVGDITVSRTVWEGDKPIDKTTIKVEKGFSMICDKARQFAEFVLRDFESNATQKEKEDIETADGRKEQNPINEKGFYVYPA